MTQLNFAVVTGTVRMFFFLFSSHSTSSPGISLIYPPSYSTNEICLQKNVIELDTSKSLILSILELILKISFTTKNIIPIKHLLHVFI